MGKWRYGIVLDAGSSGTRVHIYKWLNSKEARASANAEQLNRLPDLITKKKWTLKIKPGISTYGDKPDQVGPEYLEELFEHARQVIPKNEVAHTPLFLLATAGMRLLPDLNRQLLLRSICNYAQSKTDFLLPDCDLHIQVIKGETEGLYGWIAANHLLGGFDRPQNHDHGKGHHTYGFLDMGGASAQIAFAPNATEAQNNAKYLTLLRMRALNGEPREYKVFVTTWLGFGVHEARSNYVKNLFEESSDAEELPDPCLPSGLMVTDDDRPLKEDQEDSKGTRSHILGTGKFSECLSKTYPLLGKDAPCTDKPCLVNGVHVPGIDFDVNHFVGVSEYWHTTHEIFELGHKDRAYDFHTYQKRVEEFCSQDWETIKKDVEKHKWGQKVNEKTVIEVCFKASWLINLLHNGIGIPRIGKENMPESHNGTKEVLDAVHKNSYLDPFQAVHKINGTEVSWTLGKMLLYAASEIPPPQGSLKPVGFGSNVDVSDFQEAGGHPMDFPSNPILGESSDDVEAEDWHDTLFADSSRRIPGMVIFVLIVCVALFIFCSRDRRKSTRLRFLRILPSSSPKRRHRGGPHRRFPSGGSAAGSAVAQLAGKLFGAARSNSPSYERVLESGGYDDFELPDVDSDPGSHSDESDTGRVGRTSGWATPRLQAGSLSAGSGSASAFDTGYFEAAAASSSSLSTLAPPPSGVFAKEGLVSRTDSRERLSGLGLGLVPTSVTMGARSRNASPSRNKGPGPTGLGREVLG